MFAPPDLVHVFFIEPKSDHFVCPCHSLNHVVETWLIYDTGDVNSKLLGVVGVTDVDVEERVDDCLVEILKMFGRDFEPEFRKDVKAEVWSRFWSRSLANILKLTFGQHFEAEVWLKFWSRIVVKILISEAEVLLRFWGWSLA